MNAIASFFSSSIGRKWIVAVTGLALFGFVVGHMIGNLQIFLGPEPLNRYGAFLQGLGELLWVIRLGLLAMLVGHVFFTIKLRIESRSARGIDYAVTKRRAVTLPARVMMLSGLMVLCFIVYHLLHFTTQDIDPSYRDLHDAQGRHDIHTMMIRGFSSPLASAFYLVGVGLLAMHLQHGIQSLFQTLGLNSEKARPLLEKGGAAFAWVLFIGYASIPVAVLAGVVKYKMSATTVLEPPRVAAAAAPAARTLDSKIPSGPLAGKWERHKFESKLINPANRRKYEIIVVGSGLAGASAAASLGEMGYRVKCFCYQDSPRRAHSIAAQGGINAAKNYQNDGDSVRRLFYDTIKGGDFRAREANVYRLAEVSAAIIDQCVAQGVPFAREYGGLLANRSFGGAQVSRTFYARGQTGQQLLLGAYSALCRQIAEGTVEMFPRTEMLDLVVVDGHAKGIVVRDMVRGAITSHAGDAVLLGTGGYGNVFYLSTNAKGCNVTAAYRAYKRGAFFANPCYTQIHPTCIPQAGDYQSKLTLMSESLRNDGRVWVPKKKGDARAPDQIPEDERDYYLERKYPSFGNLAPRDISSRSAKEACDDGRGVGRGGLGVYLDFSDSIKRLSEPVVRERYGNLFDMYQQITGENAYKVPMRIYPAVHYTMGGLWVDYDLMSNVPGLFVLGEANFSDHGANRLGASALMQGLADGYFVIPSTIGNYLAPEIGRRPAADCAEFKQTEADVRERTQRMLGIQGRRSVDHFHRELGRIMWDYCGMARSEKSLQRALAQIPPLREEFWKSVKVPGEGEALNQELEKAGRVADFLEFGELLCLDALERRESCGGHFREEHQYPDGEARRDDAHFQHVAAWEFTGEAKKPARHVEPLHFEEVKPSVRSYK